MEQLPCKIFLLSQHPQSLVWPCFHLPDSVPMNLGVVATTSPFIIVKFNERWCPSTFHAHGSVSEGFPKIARWYNSGSRNSHPSSALSIFSRPMMAWAFKYPWSLRPVRAAVALQALFDLLSFFLTPGHCAADCPEGNANRTFCYLQIQKKASPF